MPHLVSCLSCSYLSLKGAEVVNYYGHINILWVENQAPWVGLPRQRSVLLQSHAWYIVSIQGRTVVIVPTLWISMATARRLYSDCTEFYEMPLHLCRVCMALSWHLFGALYFWMRTHRVIIGDHCPKRGSYHVHQNLNAVVQQSNINDRYSNKHLFCYYWK